MTRLPCAPHRILAAHVGAIGVALATLTLAACGKCSSSLADGAPVIVELEARVSNPAATDPTPLRDAIRDAWSERFRAAREAGAMAVFDAKVTGADPGGLTLVAKVHLRTDTCTQAQASRVAESVRELTTANVSFGFHRTLPDAAEVLATELRARPEVTSVTTPRQAPGAIEVTPDEVGVALARKLAPASVLVVVESVRDTNGKERQRIWVAAPSAEMDGSSVVGTNVETTNFGQLAVMVRFSDEGALAFSRITERLLQRPLLIVLDGAVLSAPRVTERLSSNWVSIVMSNRDLDAASQYDVALTLAAKIRYGTLPGTPTITKLEAHCAPSDVADHERGD